MSGRRGIPVANRLAVFCLALAFAGPPAWAQGGTNIEAFAGSGATGPGNGAFTGDGAAATSARLAFPGAVAVDDAGNVYIADLDNHRVRMVGAATTTISTFAGSGPTGLMPGAGGFSGDGGAATSALLYNPQGLAVDAAGNVYIADGNNHRVRRVDASGNISTVAGSGTAGPGNGGLSGDGGAATSARLNNPTGLAVDGAGNLYIADRFNHRIRKVNAWTGRISTVAGTGATGLGNGGFGGDGGPATSARLSDPKGIALDSAGNLYIADRLNHRVRKVDAATGNISTVAGTGTASFSGDGAAAIAATLNQPGGVAVDGADNLYISERNNHRVRRVDAATGNISTVAGTGTASLTGDGGAATSATLNEPGGLGLGANGHLYIADATNHRIRLIRSAAVPVPFVIETVAGSGATGAGNGAFSGDGGAATAARLHAPAGVALDSAGNFYIADVDNNRIRRVDAASGNISTVAGTGTGSFSGDGGAATSAALSGPYRVAVDSADNFLIADWGNHRIRRVDAASGNISTVAGTGTGSFSGDGGAATSAALNGPGGVAVDSADNIFIADINNHRIRRVAATGGTISTVAGTGSSGVSGDGAAATSAQLSQPYDVAVDSAGNFYIADRVNSRIRRVDAASGNISTFAGDGSRGFGGDGAAATSAQIDFPRGVALDSAGNLFIADTVNDAIRRVDATTGNISTVAGTTTFGFSGDGGMATAAMLATPAGVAVASDGRIYIADTGNHRIRRLSRFRFTPSRPPVEEEDEDGQGGGADSPLASFSDPGLRRAVAQALGKAPGSVTEADLGALTSLNAGSFGVASLAGLEAASNLEWLTLSGNAPAAEGEPLDLSPLAGLPSLAYLDLSDNGLTDVSDLSRLTSLRTLLLGGNAVRDLSPLSGLTGLEALTLSGNGLPNVAALSTLTALEQLWLDGNDLTDISALSALGALIYLHLGDNRITDITPLAGLSQLRRLWLPNNMVADVSALAALRALTRLDLSRNRIADASPLRGLPRLSWLRLGWNRLAEVSRLAGHPRLADGGALGLRGNPLGAAALDTHIPALREAGGVVVFGWAVPLFPSAADAAERSGVVRVLNRSDMDGTVLVEAVDEAGQTAGPATLSLAAGAAASFDSADLENGNAEMGLTEGIGPPTQGNWRLLLWSALDIEVLAYLRTPDGFLTAAHAELPRTGDSLSAFLFNPASNRLQRSSLHVFNPAAEPARMSVWGVDDAGRGRFASGFMAPPNAPLALRAGQLERSRSAAGAGLGNGAGKWRLRVAAPWPLSASTFLESPSGHVSNLSSAPLRAAADEMLRLPLFPSATNPAGREGFARVANMTAAEGMVEISAVDDAGVRAGPVRLQLAARATMHFNSDDLENGNAKKGLASGVGAPTKGMWRLELQSSTIAFAAATYARHADGFVTSLHETAPAAEDAARVAVFHPASRDEQRSLLRLANNGDEPALAIITGVDDAGATSEPLTVTVPAGEALTLTAAQLEDGDEGLEGALGDGAGKWRLTVEFDNPLTVMSLLESPAGHLSNLSATARP